MKNMNCVSTMPEIMPEVTDEASSKPFSLSGLTKKRSSTVPFSKSLRNISAS